MVIKYPRELTIAAWQVQSSPGDIETNLRSLDAAAKRASDSGAHLLITPEMYLTGYVLGEGVITSARLEPLPRVAEIAERNGIGIVVGGPELVKERVANAAWFFNEQGDLLAKHHKMRLFGELDREMFRAGDVASTPVLFRGFSISMLICYDVEFPENVRDCALAGADLVTVPTAQMHPYSFVNDHVVRTRAWENGVYVAYANQVGTEGGLSYVGRSVIAGPMGEHLDEAGSDDECLLFVKISKTQLELARRTNTYLDDLRAGQSERS